MPRRDPAFRPPSRGESIPPDEADPGAYRWIVDGHNAIFAVREWEDLQVTGRRGEARRALEECLEAFGRAAGCRVLLVFDGNRIEANPDAVDLPHLRSEYSFPPEEADDRIRFLADRALKDGARPAVVTSDRRTLASTLPPGTRWVSVGRFFRRVLPGVIRRPEKWAAVDLDDIERHFLEVSPFEEDRRALEDKGGKDEPSPDTGGPGESRSPGSDSEV